MKYCLLIWEAFYATNDVATPNTIHPWHAWGGTIKSMPNIECIKVVTNFIFISALK